MARYAYVNGRFVPHHHAFVHIEDRGFQFADAVYEVMIVIDGCLIDEQGHLDRLERSLGELKIASPVSRRVLAILMRELVSRNGVTQGLLYLQISRGVAPRDYGFPVGVKSSLVMTTKWSNGSLNKPEMIERGVSVITIPDIRWMRRDIKTVGLLAQSMGKQQAREQGAFEAWQVDTADGTVTEGCSSNAWIVTGDGVLVTRAPSHLILNGVTRLSMIRLVERLGIRFESRPFTVDEALRAQEAFMTSAGTIALPITRIDGRPIGTGKPGPVCLGLRQAYLDYAAKEGRSEP